MSLEKYNDKRDFNKTKEPIGKKGKNKKKLIFVVQHHLARKDHYDLRLEWNGVLKSWAVPKGPSYNPKDKRLAVMVEDHPYTYRNFEGTIPKGEYGGGTVMLFDEGEWIPKYKPDFNKEIKFELKGHRLNGAWTLVPFKDDNWLLIKEGNEPIKNIDITKYDTSIKTGCTMKEIENNKKINKKNVVEGITITNPDKIIFKNPMVNKMDIVSYYQKVADLMLPYLENRIVSVIRAPSGIENDIFFKKHLDNDDAGIGKIKIKSDKGKKEDYYYINSKSALISEVQMNSFEFHIWGSRVEKINNPDMMVIDLDPDEAMSINKVRQGVKDLKTILDEFKLQSFLKTSGGKGYHVVIPFKEKITWKEFRGIANNIAKLMEARWPDKYVANMSKSKRKNKIFIDWQRNIKGSTSVAPYSVRLRKKATVSMPILWSELDKIKPDEITIDKALKRIKRKNPWADFL
ncbi:MAG: non-homologous end-joining DNA ligase [Bacilli bacterium]|nr:non-homologous end-joining DNA ligase [Bacilli bacterium]